jgi:hypothetical protein
VTCSATDSSNNTSSGSFDITVSDATAPTLSLPTVQPVEATGPDGAAVTFTVTASDNIDGDITPSCTIDSGAITVRSGDTFPLGTTTVTCSATDNAGNTANGNFAVEVQDTTPPTAGIISPLGSSSYLAGELISFQGSASDIVGVTAAEVTFNGTTTPLSLAGLNTSLDTTGLATGQYTVTLDVFDDAGNSATQSVSINVN